MSRAYVNISRLRERCRKGEVVRSMIFDDLKRLEDDLKKLGVSGSVSAEDLDALNVEIGVIRSAVENITAVCEYDRYAAERYDAAAERIKNMTGGIRL